MKFHQVCCLTVLTLLAFAGNLASTDLTYQMPPQAVADLVDALWTPRVSISPDKEWMLLMQYPGLPSINEVSQPELRLGGLRINPRTNGPSRGWYLTGLKLKRVSDGEEFEISSLPEKGHFTSINWSSDSRYIAFVNTTDGLRLWVISVENRSASRLSDMLLNGVSGAPYSWMSDNKTIIAKTLLVDRGEQPTAPTVPSGPVVQENLGQKTPARTYQDMLQNAHDESVFEYFMTSQLVSYDLSGDATNLGAPGLFRYALPSPDSKYILAEQLHRPYSYTVPYYRFPLKSEVWDADGNLVYEVADLPLAETIPIAYGSVRTGRRDISWRKDVDATLYWAEALDGGDAGIEVDERDRVFMQTAPFDKDPAPLLTLDLRYDDVTWGSNDVALVSSWWWKTRTEKTWLVSPGKPSKEPQVVWDRSWEDRYADPGSPVRTESKYGTSVLLLGGNGKELYLIGSGASPEGDRPFLDKLNLTSMETERLFRSEAPYYERPSFMIDESKGIFATRRESVTEPPNYFIRDFKSASSTQITHFPHPTPQLKDVQKEMIRYERDDGVQLTATLYLPVGYKVEDGPLPMLMWAYPQEYKSADAAGQVTDSPYRFVRIEWYSPLLWLAHGFAVLDDPTMPIIGEGKEEPNDKFIEQLVSSAKAAVDEVTKRGVTDADHIAIGGHSYGAFMTANLLAHSDLFRAGIARSGAYNRTLTPFGFQSEERTLWESPEIYFGMSPFMHADKVNEPILLIHGEADNNSGTFPLQSKRYYAALKGHGATVRLVMLPHESHGYRARESVMHVLYESAEWMDRYVKNAPPREHLKTKSEAGAAAAGK